MESYEQNLHIEDSAFEKMRADANLVLQRLIKNMVEKDSMEGKVTITIDVGLHQEFIPNRDPNIKGESRRVLTPKFSHKVGSVMQIKNEQKGDVNFDGAELVWDEYANEYILKPIANTEQMSIFDADYQCVNDEYEQPALEGRRVVPLLDAMPEPEEDDEPTEEVSEEPVPFSEEDGSYDYEEPDEYEEEE